MSHEYRKTPKVPGTPDCFSIGRQEIELDKETVERFSLAQALDRLGAELLDQVKGMKTSGGKVIVGFEFHTIGFTYILERDKTKV